jgi:peptidoglycan/LPS O-acetylase OafA/YrhL
VDRNNNFTLIRLIAASLVVLSHSFLIANGSDPLEEILPGLTIGRIGLACFFLLSGYLVAGSWLRDSSFKRFILRRVLRIFPGLIAAGLFSALLAGAVLTKLSLIDYFSDSQTYVFIFKTATLQTIDNQLPGVLVQENFPLNQINAPLWTLPIECFAYLGLGLAGLFASKTLLQKIPSQLAGFCLLGVATVSWYFLYKTTGAGFGDLAVQSFWLLSLFAFGVGLKLVIEQVKSVFGRPWVGVVLLGLVFLAAESSFQIIVVSLMVAYLMFSFAWMQGKPLTGLLEKVGDLSYGIYVYAYPLQLILFSWFGFNWAVLFSTSLLLSAIVAGFSWRLIEKPALNLKPKPAK